MVYNRRTSHGKTTRQRQETEWILAVGHHRPLLSGGEFVEVQRRLEKLSTRKQIPRAGTGKKGMLVILVKCGYCGRSMSVSYSSKNSSGNDRTYAYYKCLGKYKGVCKGQSISLAVLDNLAIDLLKKIFNDPEFHGRQMEAAKRELRAAADKFRAEKENLLRTIRECERQQKNLIVALGEAKVGVKLIEGRLAELEQEKTNAENRLLEIEEQLAEKDMEDINYGVVQKNIKRFRECFDQLTLEEQRAVVQCLVERVTVTGRQVDVQIYAGSVLAMRGQPSVTAELGIPRLDPLEKRMAQLYEKGFLISFDKESRIRPLEIPVKPEWLGVETLRRVGAATRRVAYRVSIFDEADLRSLQRKREAARELLRRFSFSLADGQWWIPDRAVPLFKKELERVNSEGLEQLRKTIGNDAKKFIENRKEKILKDMETMYQEFHPGQPLPEESSNYVLSAVDDRLHEIGKERLLPKVSYAAVRFPLMAETRWQSPWAQALTLLSDIAEFPRKAITDRFFLRGIRVDIEELLEAMDVCKDVIVRMWREGSYVKVKDCAAKELVILKEIMAEQVDPRAKYAAIMGLIDGATHEEIRQKLKMPNDISDSGIVACTGEKRKNHCG